MASQGAVEKVPNSPKVELPTYSESDSSSESDSGSGLGVAPASLLAFDEHVEDEIGMSGRLVCAWRVCVDSRRRVI